MEPLVSVIVPTYNRAYCVGRAIDTALAQTHRNVEVVVIDDGSTDNTAEVIAREYGHDPRVRYLRQQNTGVSGARNTGLLAARGDYMALLDSDDLWLPWKLELQLRVFQTWPDVGMVWTEMEAIDPEGRTLAPRYLKTFYGAYRWWTFDDLFTRRTQISAIAPDMTWALNDADVGAGEIYSQMLMGNLVHTSTVLVSRERFERVGLFDPTLQPAGEDYEFHLRTTQVGPVAFVDVPSIRYQRGFADRLTRPEFEIHMATNFLRVVEPRLKKGDGNGRLPPWMQRRVLADAYAWVGSEELTMGRRSDARRHLVRSLAHDWKQARIAALYFLACLPESTDRGIRNAYRWLRGRPMRTA